MLALLFPGQGSQKSAWAATSTRRRARRETSSRPPTTCSGFALSKLCFEGPDDELRRTEIQQPAILATSIALLRALEERVGPSRRPSSRVTASASTRRWSRPARSSSTTRVRLVHARGRFMHEAVPEGLGAMAAMIGAARARSGRGLPARGRADAGASSTPANFNAPGQTVIAGDAAAVEVALRAGARARREAHAAAPGVGALPLRADGAGGRAAARSSSRACASPIRGRRS